MFDIKKINVFVFACLHCFFMGAFSSFSQTDIHFSQYMQNPAIFNSGYVGINETIVLTGQHRSQWLGIEGAPLSYSFMLDLPVGTINENQVAMAVSFLNDKIGAENYSFAIVDGSYTLRMNETLKLAFGLKAGFNLHSFDISRVDIHNPDDNVLASLKNRYSPVLGVGAFLYQNQSWYLGLSTPNIFETSYFIDESSPKVNEKSTFYLIGGYVFKLNQEIDFKPALLTRAVIGAPLAVQISSNFRYKDSFDLGIAYQFGSEISVLAGIKISNSLYAGYEYDFNTNNLGRYASGSHGLILKYSLPVQNSEISVDASKPRFF